jgi:hypothetical protein
VAFDGKGLAGVGKVEVVVELGSDPDFAGFDPSVIWGRKIEAVRHPPTAELERLLIGTFNYLQIFMVFFSRTDPS